MFIQQYLVLFFLLVCVCVCVRGNPGIAVLTLVYAVDIGLVNSLGVLVTGRMSVASAPCELARLLLML